MYRAIVAIYTLVWLIINIVEAPGSETNNGQSPFVFLTTWSYILLNLYLYTSLIDSIYLTYKHNKDGDIHLPNGVLGHGPRMSGVNVEGYKEEKLEHDYRMKWYHKVVWVLHDMITGAAPVVSNNHLFKQSSLLLKTQEGSAVKQNTLSKHSPHNKIPAVVKFNESKTG